LVLLLRLNLTVKGSLMRFSADSGQGPCCADALPGSTGISSWLDLTLMWELQAAALVPSICRSCLLLPQGKLLLAASTTDYAEVNSKQKRSQDIHLCEYENLMQIIGQFKLFKLKCHSTHQSHQSTHPALRDGICATSCDALSNTYLLL
jgi:hypothetical protein